MYDPIADTAEPFEWLPADDPYPTFGELLDYGLTDPQPPEDTYWTHETVEPDGDEGTVEW